MMATKKKNHKKPKVPSARPGKPKVTVNPSGHDEEDGSKQQMQVDEGEFNELNSELDELEGKLKDLDELHKKINKYEEVIEGLSRKLEEMIEKRLEVKTESVNKREEFEKLSEALTNKAKLLRSKLSLGAT